MATVTGFTADRMLAIENASVVSGAVVGDNLILTHHDASTTNAGNVRGPVGAPGVSEAVFNNTLVNYLPIGSIVDYMGITAPTNWLLIQGQTVVNAESLYPNWWAVVPSAMKSGSNVILPNAQGRVSVGYNGSDSDFNAIGKTGGEKTHLLTTTEMPSHDHSLDDHTHTIDHDHPNQNTSTESSSHTHAITLVETTSPHSHSFNGTTSGQSANHTHTPGGSPALFIVESMIGGDFSFQNAGVGTETVYRPETTSGVSNDHTHTYAGGTSIDYTTHTHSAGASSESALHYHTFDVSPFSGTSGESGRGSTKLTGSGTAHNNIQPYVVFTKIVKVL